MGGEFADLEEDEYDALNDETFGSDAIGMYRIGS